MPILKTADASTLTVATQLKNNMDDMRSVLPKDCKLELEFDQSPYVTGAVGGVVQESAIGAVLTGLMVLLFLGDWRSVVVVVLTIPLSLMGALIGLFITGQSINLMTLGGMSLAVGILVDMGTVVIENIHTQMGKTAVAGAGRARRHGGDDGADLAGHALHPGGVSAVVPDGRSGRQSVRAAGHLGRLRHDHGVHPVDHLRAGAVDLDSESRTPTATTKPSRRRGPVLLRPLPARLRQGRAAWCWPRAGWCWAVTLVAAALVLGVCGLQVGQEISPQVDAGQFQMRLKAPVGTRLEVTEELTRQALEGDRRTFSARTASRSRWPTSARRRRPSPPTPSSCGPAVRIRRSSASPSTRRKGFRTEEVKERLRKELPERLKPWLAKHLIGLRRRQRTSPPSVPSKWPSRSSRPT